MRKEVKIVITGEVDHGKSTLIGKLVVEKRSIPLDKLNEALTDEGKIELAHLVDYLEEERKERRTIDVGHATFRTKQREYKIIDTPGHIEFIKNMLSGSSQAEVGVMVVDVNKGITGEGKRQLYILKLVGVERLIVGINKMDECNYKEEVFERVKRKVEETLTRLEIECISCIPISALKGDNVIEKSNQMKWYEGRTLLEALDSVVISHPEGEGVIFPVQGVYKVDGNKVIMGKLENGALKKGEVLHLLPQKKEIKIKNIVKYLSHPTKACKGEAVGLKVVPQMKVRRGDILCSPSITIRWTNHFRGMIFVFNEEGVSVGEKFQLECSLQRVEGWVKKISNKINPVTLKVRRGKKFTKLRKLEAGEVEIETTSLIGVERLRKVPQVGRFVIEKDKEIIGVGVVV